MALSLLTDCLSVNSINTTHITYDGYKDAANADKHGVSLALATDLEWDSALVWPDMRRVYGELEKRGQAHLIAQPHPRPAGGSRQPFHPASHQEAGFFLFSNLISGVIMGRVKGSISKDRTIEAETLREVLKPIYEKLRNNGVSEPDLPSSEELVGRLLEHIDQKSVDQWTQKYADWVKQKP